MQKKHLILALLFGIPTASFGANDPTAGLSFQSSPYKACQDVALISKSDYKKNKEFWDVAIGECGADVQVMPDGGFYASMVKILNNRISSNVEDNARAESFLRKVGAKSMEYADGNLKLAKLSAACVKGDASYLASVGDLAKKCDTIKSDLKDVAADVGSKARVQYAAMKEMASLFGMLGNAMKKVTGLQTDLEKAPLTDKEKEEVRKMVKAADERIGEKVKGMEGMEPEAYGAAIEMARGEEFKKLSEDFVTILQKAPFVAYLGKGGEPSDADLGQALDRVAQNADGEMKKIQEAVAAADKAVGVQNKAKKMMEFMNYGPVLEEVLKSDPSLCQSGTTLANYVANKELRNAGLTMGAILATGGAAGAFAGALGAGTLVAGAVGTAASLVPSATMIYKADYDKYLAAEQRTFANTHEVEGKEGGGKNMAELKDFEEARDSLTMDVATSPMDLMGLGIGKGLVAGATGAYTGAKMLAKPAAVNAARKALLKRGFNELSAAKVIADIKGNDAAKAGRALAQLTEALGVDTKELKVARNLVDRGVLKSGDTASFDRAMERLRELKPAERDVVYKNIDETLANVNPAKINAANRDQALEAIVSGSKFGVNPEQLARKVGDWDNGLDGLARTYDLAKKKMDLPEVRGLASTEAKQEAAFSRALDELFEQNPEFKALKKEEKLAAKEQMMGCGLKGK